MHISCLLILVDIGNHFIFGISITDLEAEKVKTVGSIYDLIEQKL